MSIMCLVLHIGIFGTYLTLSTLLIPRVVHQNDLCNERIRDSPET